MSGEYGDWAFWIDVVWKVGTVIGLVWLSLRRDRLGILKRIEEFADDLGAFGKRLGTVEHSVETMKSDKPSRQDIAEIENDLTAIQGDLKAAPTRADIDKLHDRIGKVGGGVADVRERLGGVEQALVGVKELITAYRDAVNRLTEHHLKD